MFKYTKFTSDSGILTKSFRHSEAKPVNPRMTSGSFEIVTVSTLEAFAEEIRGLQKNQAHSYSLPEIDSGRIVIKGDPAINCEERIIPRSKEYFSYPCKSGILFVDIDNNDPEEEVISKLSEMHKPFAKTSYVYATSASHGINGKQGYHLYFFIPDLSIVRQAMKNLFGLSFIYGHGYFKTYDNGSLHKRSICDFAVYDPARLDFIAGPVCDGFDAPQRDIRVVHKENEELDLEPLLKSVDASADIQEARELAKPELVRIRTEVAMGKGISLEAYERILDNGEIHPPYTLYSIKGNVLDLETILIKSSEAYLGNVELDEASISIQHPVEGGLSEKTNLYYNPQTGCPIINTFAHGGQVWNLRHTEESFAQLTGGTPYQRNSLRYAHNLLPLATDNRLPLHDKTDEVFEMMKTTFQEIYQNDRILELQWKEQISLYLQMILEGHKGRYSIELGMGSAKTQVILHVILYLYREGHQIPLAVAFEKIKEIDHNYIWLIERMSEIWKSKSEEGVALQYPDEYLKRRHSQEQTPIEKIQNAPIIFHTHHVVRKEDFLDSFFSYKGKKRHLFIYDEALPTGLELSVKVDQAIDHLNHVISRSNTRDLQGLPGKWLSELRDNLEQAQRRLNDNFEIQVVEIDITQLPGHFVRTGYYIDNENVSSFIVTLFQIGTSDDHLLQVSREKNGNAFMGFKANQTAEIDRLINTDASRTIRKVHEYSSTPIEKYTIPEWSGDERGSITIVPFRRTGKESVIADHVWHIPIINEWQKQRQSEKLLICTSKDFPTIDQGCPQGMLRGIPGGLKHDNVSFTTWGQHKQTNEFRDCDGIVALHYFRKPYFAYKNSIYAEQGHFGPLSIEAVREVEYGSIVEALQQLFGRGTKRLGKKCDCLLFASSVSEAEEVIRRLAIVFPLDEITLFDRPEWLWRFEQSLSLPQQHTGGSEQVWSSPIERQWANDFKTAAKKAGYDNYIALVQQFVTDRHGDNSITPKKWLKANI